MFDIFKHPDIDEDQIDSLKDDHKSAVKLLGNLMTICITLESLGIKSEDDKSIFENLLFQNPLNVEDVMRFKLSVPEKCSVTDDDDDGLPFVLGDRPYETSEDLINIAKYLLRDCVNDCFSDYIEDYREVQTFLNLFGLDNAEDRCKILVKVRKGETWTNTESEKAAKECSDYIKNYILSYTEFTSV